MSKYNDKHDDDFGQSAETLSKLSSGWTDHKGNDRETVFSFGFDFLKDAGNWSDAVAKLIGLVN